MYSGISNVSVPDCDVPEWKKILIMKKRVGCSPAFDEHSRPPTISLLEENNCDKVKISEHPKTVKIGSINVELRNVKPVEIPNCLMKEKNNKKFEDAEQFSEDLQYGPGIVDRLRARFLNIGVKQQTKPAVRRFSSLENLPGIPYRVNTRGIRQNGFKSGFSPGNVKKAQSMETLNCSSPEQHIFSTSRRPNTRLVVGTKVRILSKNVSPTDENDKSLSPRLFNKSTRRWDYGGSVITPNINEDELPKPDTVKHVKKMFESPLVNNSEKTAVSSFTPRFRKIPSTTTPTSHAVYNNSAIIESEAWPAVKKTEEDAKSTCAKDFCNVNNAAPSSVCEEEKNDDFVINEISDNDLSACGSCEAEIAQETSDLLGENNCQLYSSDLVPSNKVTPERLPLELSHKQSDSLSQEATESSIVTGDQVGMVVVGEDPPKKSWKKNPQPATSIIFDFRGRQDVEPHISHNPAPFGCRPAKISRNSSSKRTGSPPRINGTLTEDDDHLGGDEDEEDWDEMDIGADLPLISGIVFVGENVKIGRSSFLETRDKKLNIKFDDKTTSTYEYPSENCFSVSEEKVLFDSSTAMGSAANSRLSNYTPQVLCTDDEFELGVSNLSHRPVRSPKDNEVKESITDILVPVDPGETVGWSATETADILF